MFNRHAVDAAIKECKRCLSELGYTKLGKGRRLESLVSHLCLRTGTTDISQWPDAEIEAFSKSDAPKVLRATIAPLTRALHGQGYAISGIDDRKILRKLTYDSLEGVAPEWINVAREWLETSTLATRRNIFNEVVRVGYWLSANCSEITHPRDWDYKTCVKYVAAVGDWKVGDYLAAMPNNIPKCEIGKPMKPQSKNTKLIKLRTFFHDLQEWEWIPRHFNPSKALKTPKSIMALCKEDPRDIDLAIWVKLTWAAHHLEPSDIPKSNMGKDYPFELYKAIAICWVYIALRNNDYLRLRVGCAREVMPEIDLTDPGAELDPLPTCEITVPVTKKSRPFVKPTYAFVGDAIHEWEKVRPRQPKLLDTKTGEMVEFLFMHRGKRVGENFINATLIPLLCKKGGVPEEDARGRITSHRARATIPTELINAPEPMSIFEIKEWMGYEKLETVERYARQRPAKLRRSYKKADYFRRNMRMVDVLIDRDAIMSGEASKGAPFLFVDIVDAYCANAYWHTCKYRMACQRCEFHIPKDSAAGIYLESKANVIRMKQEVPLSDEEQDALEDHVLVLDRLLAMINDEPTLDGRRPSEIRAQENADPSSDVA